MNPEDLKQLNRRFDEMLTILANQDKLSLKRGEAQYKMAQYLKDENGKINKQLGEMQEKLDPMYKIFSNINGFNKITLTLFKGILIFGAVAGVIYGFFKWLKN